MVGCRGDRRLGLDPSGQRAFLSLPEGLKPVPLYVRLFRAVVVGVWRGEQDKARYLRKQRTSRVADLQARLERLEESVHLRSIGNAIFGPSFPAAWLFDGRSVGTAPTCTLQHGCGRFQAVMRTQCVTSRDISVALVVTILGVAGLAVPGLAQSSGFQHEPKCGSGRRTAAHESWPRLEKDTTRRSSCSAHYCTLRRPMRVP